MQEEEEELDDEYGDLESFLSSINEKGESQC